MYCGSPIFGNHVKLIWFVYIYIYLFWDGVQWNGVDGGFGIHQLKYAAFKLNLCIQQDYVKLQLYCYVQLVYFILLYSMLLYQLNSNLMF